MFALRVHSVDSAWGREATSCSSSPAELPENTNRSPPPPLDSSLSVRVLRGVVHLFRPISASSSYAAVAAGVAPSVAAAASSSYFQSSTDSPLRAPRGKILLLLAVPNRLSVNDLIRFCGPYIDQASEIHVIRNDAVEDLYSVLVRFDDQESAESLYLDLNARSFSSPEPEVCHVLFVGSVEYTESTHIASSPPAGYTELPICPVCLEQLDQEISGIIATTYDQDISGIVATSKWTNLSCLVCQFCRGPFLNATCSTCGISEQLWICLICGFVGCGRYKEGHARGHWEKTQHCFSLDPQAQRVWDYVGDRYVHRLNQSKSDGKNQCSCIWRQYEFLSEEYSQLLSKTLQDQRQHYEALLLEEKQKGQENMPEMMEKIFNTRLQDIQHKLEICTNEKKDVADINGSLLKSQNLWQEKLKKIEEREKATLKLKDERIHELEEEIRDFTIFMEARKTIGRKGGADDIRGGTILPVPSRQPPPGRTGRSSRAGRRHN